ISAALYCLVRGRDEEAWVGWAGLPLGFAVVCRPTNLALAVPVACAVVWRHPRRAVLFLLGALALACFQIRYNVSYFGDPLHVQFPTHGSWKWRGSPWQGLAGLLLSPARGLFVYSPVLLFSIVGLAGAWRKGGDGLLRALGVGAVLVVLVHARWWAWWGGATYGPRLLADL